MTMSNVEDKYVHHKGKNPLFYWKSSQVPKSGVKE